MIVSGSALSPLGAPRLRVRPSSIGPRLSPSPGPPLVPWALPLSLSALSPLRRPLPLELLTYFLIFPRHHLEIICCFTPNKVPQAIRLVLLS